MHVGPHKTGSTSLQTTLVLERATLLAQDNIAVLPNSIPGGTWRAHKAGANVAFCLSGQATTCCNCTKVLHYFEEFLKDARRARRGIILSSEAFDRPRVAEKLAATLRGFESTIAIVHRPYFDWVRSCYTEERSRGLRQPMTLSEYVSADRIRDAAASLDVNSVSVIPQIRAALQQRVDAPAGARVCHGLYVPRRRGERHVQKAESVA